MLPERADVQWPHSGEREIVCCLVMFNKHQGQKAKGEAVSLLLAVDFHVKI